MICGCHVVDYYSADQTPVLHMNRKRIMAWRFCLTNTCFALLPTVCYSMVPGNLPSQPEILSTGQTYYGTGSATI